MQNSYNVTLKNGVKQGPFVFELKCFIHDASLYIYLATSHLLTLKKNAVWKSFFDEIWAPFIFDLRDLPIHDLWHIPKGLFIYYVSTCLEFLNPPTQQIFNSKHLKLSIPNITQDIGQISRNQIIGRSYE